MARSPESLELALAESIHRARNDLQAVSAMLRLQAASTDSLDVRNALEGAADRVDALAHLNARLNSEAEAGVTAIEMPALLQGLAEEIRVMHVSDRPIELRVEAGSHPLDIETARALGLILNELVVNALKYAFPDRRAGIIAVAFRCGPSGCELTVIDNGVGYDPAAAPRGSGLGRVMVAALAAQIGAVIEIGRAQAGGTACTMRW